MARTHTFKGSGANYFAYIEDGQLVIGEDWGREGGILYRGPYKEAGYHLKRLAVHAPKLYNSIVDYYDNEFDGIEFEPEIADRLKEIGWDSKTKTVLFKVKLHMDNGNVHNVLVRGRSQAGVIQKLFPAVPEVLTIQTYDANVFAVRSEKIYAAEFVED